MTAPQSLAPSTGILRGRVHVLPVRVYYEDTDAADRDALNDPSVAATESHHAYRLQTKEPATTYAGAAWAKKHGFEFADVSKAPAKPSVPAR